MTRARLALVAVFVMSVLVFTLPASAEAREKRICAKVATVRDTPRGFAIARLYRRQKVRTAGRSAARGWTPIETLSGLPGWILTSSLCRG
jgi:hypothetical protein